jgi:hypothetical protein
MFEQLSAHGYQRVALWDRDGNWIGTRSVANGVADLIPGLPGEPTTGYLDVAFFGPGHAAILSAVERAESESGHSRKLGSIRSSLRSIAGHSRLSAR